LLKEEYDADKIGLIFVVQEIPGLVAILVFPLSGYKPLSISVHVVDNNAKQWPPLDIIFPSSDDLKQEYY